MELRGIEHTMHQSKPICTHSQHVQGSWVAAPSHMALAREHPPCCFKDGDWFMTAPHHCGTNCTAQSPKWDTDTVSASQTWPLSHTGGSACMCLGYQLLLCLIETQQQKGDGWKLVPSSGNWDTSLVWK